MNPLKSIEKSHPLATVLFIKWIMARNTLRPFTQYLRKPVDELPIEMLYGIAMLFFHEHGVLFSPRVSSAGRIRLLMYVRRLTGVFTLASKSPFHAKPEKVMELTIRSGMAALNRKLKRGRVAIDSDKDSHLVIGLNVDEVLTELEYRNAS